MGRGILEFLAEPELWAHVRDEDTFGHSLGDLARLKDWTSE